MKLRLLLYLPLLCWQFVRAGSTGVDLQGLVRDADSFKPLAAAHLVLEELSLGCACDTDGHFLMTNLPAGDWHLRISHLGYSPLRIELRLPEDASSEFVLALQAISLKAPAIRVYAPGELVSASSYSIDLYEDQTTRAIPLAQALEQLPGVEVKRDARGRAVASLRGCRPDQVQVLLDGLPLGSASGEAVDLNQLPPGSVSRVEVQSTPGSSAGAGGVIRLFSSPATVSGRLAVGSASWGTRQTDLQVGGQHGGLDASLWVHHRQADNDFPYTAESDLERERLNNDSRREQALLKLERNLGTGRLGLLLLGDLLQTGSPSPLYLPPATEARQQRFQARARLYWSGNDGHRQQLEYWRARHGLDHPAQQWNPWTGAIVYHLPSRLREHQAGLQWDLLQPARGAWPQLGVQLSRQQFRSWDEREAGDTDLVQGGVGRNLARLELRESLPGLFDLPLELSAGAGNSLSQDRSSQAKRRDEGIFADLHLGWLGGSAQAFRLECGVSRGFSLPDFNSRFLSESVLARGNPELRPERSLMFEVSAGCRPCPTEDSCELELQLWERRSSDLVIWRSNYLGQYFPDNLARARVRGLELRTQFTRTLSTDWRCEFALSHTWQQALNTSSGSPYEGKRLPFAANWFQSSTLILRGPGPFCELRWSAAGRRYTSESNLDPGSLAGGMSPYGVLDVNVGQELQFAHFHYLLGLGVSNLLDEEWELLAGMPQAGRAWNASLSCSW